MATHGSIGEFNPARKDWVSYSERLIQYFVANGISEDGPTRRASSAHAEQIHIS